MYFCKEGSGESKSEMESCRNFPSPLEDPAGFVDGWEGLGREPYQVRAPAPFRVATGQALTSPINAQRWRGVWGGSIVGFWQVVKSNAPFEGLPEATRHAGGASVSHV